MNDVQPVEQVLSERPLLDHVAQVTIGRGDHADIDDAATAVGANLLQLTGLEEREANPASAASSPTVGKIVPMWAVSSLPQHDSAREAALHVTNSSDSRASRANQRN